MESWATGVNKKILRNSKGSVPVCVIADETRCGAKKRRYSSQLSPKVFNITMHFSTTEFVTFQSWFESTLRHGALSFGFPQIDAVNGSDTEYVFQDGTSYEWSNVSGIIVEVTMTWEEV